MSEPHDLPAVGNQAMEQDTQWLVLVETARRKKGAELSLTELLGLARRYLASKRLRLWLSCQRNGDSMLTLLEPVWAPIRGAGDSDWYMQPGDPIGLRHLCTGGVQLVLGHALEPGQKVRVQVLFEEEV